MSATRRTTILEGMFLDIATPEDRAKVNELYDRDQKGSATVLMLKRVRDVWIRLINEDYRRNHPSTLQESHFVIHSYDAN